MEKLPPKILIIRKLFSINNLQIYHFVMIGLITILGFIFFAFSDSDVDPSRLIVNRAAYIIGGVWTVFSFIYSLLFGEGSQLKKIGNGYRRLLNSNWFLFSSNLVLLVCVLYLINQHIRYRQVEIKVKHDAQVYVYLESSENQIGKVDRKKSLKVRIPTGEQSFYYHEIDDINQEFPGAVFTEIEPLWFKMDPIYLPKN